MPALKSAVSTTWFFRVDGDIEVLRPKVREFANSIDCIDCLAVHHSGKTKENPHLHAVMTMSSSCQKQSFALRLKKHFQVVDRGYALDVWDAQRTKGAVSYMFHEDDAPCLVQKGWSFEEVQAAVHLGMEIAAAVQESKNKASVKLVERALDHFGDNQASTYDILNYMIDEVHGKRAYYPGDMKLKSYIQEVEIKLTPKSQLNNLVRMYYANLFR